MHRNWSLIVVLAAAAPAAAAMKTETVEYRCGEGVFQGFIVYDDSATSKRPGVLVVHDWMGCGDFSKKRAERLAELGYVGFAVDMYGKGVHPSGPQEAAKLAGGLKANVPELRSRIQAAFELLQKHERVDAAKMSALGFCFGGTVALELARSGAPILGTVSFHGGLATPQPADAKNIKGKILVLHGADDPYVKDAEVAAFEKEMREAAVDWQLVAYGNSVHSFTNPAAGSDNSRGLAYNEAADRRSYAAMKNFFGEVFGK